MRVRVRVRVYICTRECVGVISPTSPCESPNTRTLRESPRALSAALVVEYTPPTTAVKRVALNFMVAFCGKERRDESGRKKK